MSTLAQIIGMLESGSGANVANQPASMVNPYYGQYAGFVNQYGSGAAGIDNFASQILANNPYATLGDYYATYVLGTGNPASTYSAADLQTADPAAYANLVGNSGYSLDTPLASLIGDTTIPSGATEPTEGFTGGGAIEAGVEAEGGSPSGILGSVETGIGSAVGTLFGGGGSYGALGSAIGGLFGGGGGSTETIGVTPGLATELGGLTTGLGESIVQGFDSFASGLLGGVTNWVVRGFIILVAIVLLGVALAALMFRSDTVKKATKVAAVAA